MDTHDAIELIRGAIPKTGGAWADLGAGTGTFTRALAALVGAEGQVQAIEPNAASRRELIRLSTNSGVGYAPIAASAGDFTKPLALASLSGVLMANSLHFVSYAQQVNVVKQLVTYLAPSGRLVVVEYDHDQGNQWVPYPVSLRKFVALCSDAGLTEPLVVGRMPSAFGGSLYAAWTTLG